MRIRTPHAADFDEGQASPLGFARQYGEGGDVVELWHPNRVRVPGAELAVIEFAEEESDVDAVSHRCGEARNELRELANQAFQIGIVARCDRATDQERELLLRMIEKGLQEAWISEELLDQLEVELYSACER